MRAGGPQRYHMVRVTSTQSAWQQYRLVVQIYRGRFGAAPDQVVPTETEGVWECNPALHPDPFI
jgi:hypothetical protein